MKRGIEVLLRDGGIFELPDDQIEYWEYLYPDLDVRSEIGYLKEMWTVGAIPRRTAKNVSKFINKWLSKQEKEKFLD